MSLDNKGVTCSACHAYLFDEDDVVYCPVCGAPHHRECYNSLGHCAFEQFHGTDKEYCRVKERENENTSNQEGQESNSSEEPQTPENTICLACHLDYDINLDSCPNCGAPNRLKIRTPIGFDPLGGVPADYPIEEDVTAREAMNFVLTNTHRYIPKFAILGEKKKSSWNWMAFLFPCGWFLSRKMYKNGIIAGIFTVIATLFSFPLDNVMYSLGFYDAQTYQETMDLLVSSLPEISAAALAAAAVGGILSLVLRIICGVLGDCFYKNHTVASIRRIKSSTEDIEADYRKSGGVNLFLFFVGTFAVQYLPIILNSIFWS